MKNFLLCLITLCVASLASAQTTETFTVYFDVDKYGLRSESLTELDKVVSVYNTNYVQSIKLTAHTDFNASDDYNKVLSQNRAKSVTQYLRLNDIKKNVISSTWHGESVPAATNQTKQGKQLNRRVEIEICYKPFSSANELIEVLRDEEQEFRIPTSSGYFITAKNGSELYVPSNAFEDQQGRPIDNKNVLIKVDEALSAKDGILNSLVTETSEGEMLESGGMIKVTASINGSELKLREGKEIQVGLPTKKPVDGMSVWEGKESEDGLIRWENTKRKFANGVQGEQGAPIAVDTTLLMKYYKPVSQNTNFDPLQLKLEFPMSPEKPAEPMAPHHPRKPNPEFVAFGIKKMLMSDEKKEELAQQKFEERQAVYKQKKARYDKRIVQYKKDMLQYELDYKAYEKEIAQYQSTIEEHIKKLDKIFTDVKYAYDQTRLNVAIMNVRREVRTGALKTSNPQGYILRLSEYRVGQMDISNLKMVKDQIHYFELLTSFTPAFIEENFVEKGRIRVSKMKKYWHKKGNAHGYKSFYSLRTNDQAIAMLEDQGINVMLERAKGQKAVEDKKKGITPLDVVRNKYTSSFRRLGWLNCDRLPRLKLRVVTSFAAAGVLGEKVVIYIKNIKGLMSPVYRNDLGYQLKMPPRTKAKAIHITTLNGKPQMSMVDFTAKTGLRVFPDFKEVTLAEMKHELMLLE